MFLSNDTQFTVTLNTDKISDINLLIAQVLIECYLTPLSQQNVTIVCNEMKCKYLKLPRNFSVETIEGCQ